MMVRGLGLLFVALASSAVTVVVAGTTLAQQQQQQLSGREQQILRQRFDEVDRDKDGIITIKELKRLRQRQFRNIDADGDEVIIEGEYQEFQAHSLNNRLSQMTFDEKRRQYYRMDYDHNKRVTMAEFERPALIQFRILDANRSGKICWEEFSRERLPSRGARGRSRSLSRETC